ncbi:Molybdopterin synthase catalytic subunit [Novipirellula aureliae]|uniref:Molybdopterin synthase catalytic subunit n=1 Tax=Novipirellula aureliae TaxID=2527966 RepID=A0A5C6DND1_9BACT|nr:molybdenum cofactor biosynthesis protein MoaE [Novipirellula aureliae]TWU37694.1 Molybdopterin synthase catalytic subunit [Novipirellula aureliae]
MTLATDRVFISIVEEPINWMSFHHQLEDPDVGAHGWFSGVTRRKTGDRITESLSYQAHRPMAVLELRRLANEAMARFELTRLLIVHRLGVVPIGEPSVVIGCSSAHRKQAFAALPWLMDQIKEDVPIWKKEIYLDGTTEWIHPTNQ